VGVLERTSIVRIIVGWLQFVTSKREKFYWKRKKHDEKNCIELTSFTFCCQSQVQIKNRSSENKKSHVRNRQYRSIVYIYFFLPSSLFFVFKSTSMYYCNRKLQKWKRKKRKHLLKKIKDCCKNICGSVTHVEPQIVLYDSSQPWPVLLDNAAS